MYLMQLMIYSLILYLLSIHIFIHPYSLLLKLLNHVQPKVIIYLLKYMHEYNIKLFIIDISLTTHQ
jgi:hypothetical protein